MRGIVTALCVGSHFQCIAGEIYLFCLFRALLYSLGAAERSHPILSHLLGAVAGIK